jgi:hypothetical protein
MQQQQQQQQQQNDAKMDRALLATAEAGNTSRCLELIASKANINCVLDSNGYTPLMYSISYNKPDTTMALLDAKADVTVKSKDGRDDCLSCAARQGQLALYRTLVEQHGADVNTTYISGVTPLMAAAWNGHADVCVYLLNAGARVDAKTKQGKTALQESVRCNNTDAVAAIRAWLKDRDAAAAFARGTMHARRTHKHGDWTDSMLFDKHLIPEITAFVTPPRPAPPSPARRNDKSSALPRMIMWGTAGLFFCYQFIVRIFPAVTRS